MHGSAYRPTESFECHPHGFRIHRFCEGDRHLL